MDGRVRVAEEVERFQILAPAILVGNPLAGLARIIQIKHGRHGIHPQPVNVIAVEPRHRTAQQKAAHFRPAEVEDQRAPVLMLALAGIGMFVKVRAVEMRQREKILGEMCRHPVHENADAVLVERVHQIHEILRRAVTMRRRVEAGDLITPGTVERIFRQRHELHMREAHFLDVGHQFPGEFPVVQRPVAVIRVPPPRAEVQFIDQHRLFQPVGFLAPRHPLFVAP